MQLTKERMGEIALDGLIQKMADDNMIPSVASLQRDLPDVAEKFGITIDEAKAFIMAIIPKVIERRLGCKSVGLTWEGDAFKS